MRAFSCSESENSPFSREIKNFLVSQNEKRRGIPAVFPSIFVQRERKILFRFYFVRKRIPKVPGPQWLEIVLPARVIRTSSNF